MHYNLLQSNTFSRSCNITVNSMYTVFEKKDVVHSYNNITKLYYRHCSLNNTFKHYKTVALKYIMYSVLLKGNEKNYTY